MSVPWSVPAIKPTVEGVSSETEIIPPQLDPGYAGERKLLAFLFIEGIFFWITKGLPIKESETITNWYWDSIKPSQYNHPLLKKEVIKDQIPPQIIKDIQTDFPSWDINKIKVR